ncbi:MAG: methylthioribulose 1-phosphate dehydratase [Myxococcales bacterium]|nr:methylthioribulose 1-phosphate dehydratase [Myxococcales bacterium]MCB9520950.1 methylthioribulose 1-phosphate dehydratase [Myxococcales bacterium]MCB9531686.1 methylthioribulose 1-phosphate dehydratase [Myxococcales bacterium]MCB9534427.1 methylthioribulose 1-phosphate dehydratase [Myxococcales bacterium]
MQTRPELIAQLADVGAEFHGRGWLMATGGNLSALFGAADGSVRVVMTASGGHKGRLTPDDFVDVALQGPLPTTGRRPSAEVGVHRAVYALGNVGAVLHVHSPYVTLVSRAFAPESTVQFAGFEFVKALGFWEPGAVVDAPIVRNHHDLDALAAAVGQAATSASPCPGVLVAGHGLYAWGATVADARRHVEAFEFLCHMVWESRR